MRCGIGGSYQTFTDQKIPDPCRHELFHLRSMMDAAFGSRDLPDRAGEVVNPGRERVLALHDLPDGAHTRALLFRQPLVLQGVGLAVLPSAWAPLARRAGARTARLDPTAHLHIALVNRSAPMTPAARAFLAVARAYKPVDHLNGPLSPQGDQL